MIDSVLKNYSTAFEKLFPMLKKTSKLSYIGFAVLLLAVHQAHSFLVVPKHLRHFPKVSFFSMIKSYYYKESVADRQKRLIAPLIKDNNGFYINRIPFTWTIYVTDPVAARTLLLKTENFPKSHAFFDKLETNSLPIQFLGKDNVAVSNGDTWKSQRKIMNPAFHRSMPVKTFGGVMPDLFAAIDEESDNVSIALKMRHFTLDALGLAAFGFNFQALKGDPEGWTKTYNTFILSLFDPWLSIFVKADFLIRMISPGRRRIMEASTKFNSMLDDLTNKKRQEILEGKRNGIPEKEKDLLTLMIEADIREGGEASTEQLRHNIALFFLAGHDTTAHTLSFCLYNLAANKHVQRKAREEVLRILGDEPVDIIPTEEELKQMDYINLVIKENLRHSGPVDRLFSRKTGEDMELAGTVIPKGAEISIDVASIHLSPKNWQNPDHFIPERFEEGGEHEGHTGLTWVPFSNGSRQCLGMNFSLTEQRVVLAMILRKYEIELPKDSIHKEKIVFDMAFNFAPESLCLKFTKRY
ncbi:cytochrome P450 [Mucor mucedo]|uniref:cytochrome P450 n=1 Tax=Mucor mucedo TaxID=29922 RepID=UPI0022210988|nr:cytochrome P450 [Mucor mucedo]KAI7895101.1 cytochrome P450 [Mucor mucedo]